MTAEERLGRATPGYSVEGFGFHSAGHVDDAVAIAREAIALLRRCQFYEWDVVEQEISKFLDGEGGGGDAK